MIEVSIRPAAWSSPLVVDRALELGTPVKKGDILVEFDHDKIDKAIDDAQVENAISDLALKRAEEEVPILDKALPVDLASALRAKTQADDDLKKFLEIDRAHSERNAQFMVKRSVEFLEYAKEELRQLKKMYRSKDLTEETEEIILRRQRFQVESGEFSLKDAQLRRDQTLNVDLPRQEQQVRDKAVKLTIDLEKARALLPLNLNQKRVSLARLPARPRQIGAKSWLTSGVTGTDSPYIPRPTVLSTMVGVDAGNGRPPPWQPSWEKRNHRPRRGVHDRCRAAPTRCPCECR